MKRDEVVVNGLHAFHFFGETTDYALIILHGTGGHGGCYDGFCEYHADRGADIYSLSLPGHGKSRGERGIWDMQECLDATDEFARHLKQTTDLPVFVLGSSQGSGMALYVLDQSDAITGAITMCLAAFSLSPFKERFAFMKTDAMKELIDVFGASLKIDTAQFMNLEATYGSPEVVAKLFEDPDLIWHYPLQSWMTMATYEPPRPPTENTKPILITVGENDPIMPPKLMEMLAEQVGGPMTYHMVPGGPHQVMLECTEEYSALVDGWVREQLAP